MNQAEKDQLRAEAIRHRAAEAASHLYAGPFHIKPEQLLTLLDDVDRLENAPARSSEKNVATYILKDLIEERARACHGSYPKKVYLSSFEYKVLVDWYSHLEPKDGFENSKLVRGGKVARLLGMEVEIADRFEE